MKNIIILFVCVILFFAGCSRVDKETSSHGAPVSPFFNEEQKTSTERKNENTRFLIENTAQNSISIALPVSESLTGSHNLLMETFVCEKIEDICDKEFTLTKAQTGLSEAERLCTDYYIDLSGSISYQSADTISVVFEGILNLKGTAHPTHLFFTLNFNPKTTEIISFLDRYVLDDELYGDFATQAQANILEQTDGQWPAGWGTFSETLCSKERFLEEVASGEICFYYTEDRIGFSYEVPFALGNHMEVELPYSCFDR